MNLLLFFLISSFTWGGEIISRINFLELSKSTRKPHLVRLNDGRVAFLIYDSPLLESVRTHTKSGSLVRVTVNQWNEITMVGLYNKKRRKENSRGTHCTDPLSYKPKACEGFTMP